MVPQIIGYFIAPIIKIDTIKWKNSFGLHSSPFSTYLYLLTYFPEFRNLIYYRLHMRSVLTPPMNSLYLNADHIGEGLFIQHGFSTIVAAKSIGKNCWINQQVTIGYNNMDYPTIGDNVTICAEAIIIGNVKIGDNATIGAGAIVVDDVPANSVVCSPKARVVHYKNEM